jgi:hypothetical protein
MSLIFPRKHRPPLRRVVQGALICFLVCGSRGDRALAADQASDLEHSAVDAFSQGHYADAAETFEKAYEVDPRPALLYNAARSYNLAGNKERALALYERFLDTDPKTDRRAEIESRAMELRRAIAEDFERAYEASPDPALLYSAAQAYRLAGDKERALTLYEAYLTTYGGTEERAEIEFRIDQLRKAIASEAVSKEPPKTTNQGCDTGPAGWKPECHREIPRCGSRGGEPCRHLSEYLAEISRDCPPLCSYPNNYRCAALSRCGTQLTKVYVDNGMAGQSVYFDEHGVEVASDSMNFEWQWSSSSSGSSTNCDKGWSQEEAVCGTGLGPTLSRGETRRGVAAGLVVAGAASFIIGAILAVNGHHDRVAEVAMISGGMFTGGGIGLWLLAPRPQSAPQVAVGVGPRSCQLALAW